jgi:hypothetical protein
MLILDCCTPKINDGNGSLIVNYLFELWSDVGIQVLLKADHSIDIASLFDFLGKILWKYIQVF